jgi:hypothetical protein
VPQVGDRLFARIVQPFLHNYGHITLANISIDGPDHPLIQHDDVPMPENIEDFEYIGLKFAISIIFFQIKKWLKLG